MCGGAYQLTNCIACGLNERGRSRIFNLSIAKNCEDLKRRVDSETCIVMCSIPHRKHRRKF